MNFNTRITLQIEYETSIDVYLRSPSSRLQVEITKLAAQVACERDKCRVFEGLIASQHNTLAPQQLQAHSDQNQALSSGQNQSQSHLPVVQTTGDQQQSRERKVESNGSKAPASHLLILRLEQQNKDLTSQIEQLRVAHSECEQRLNEALSELSFLTPKFFEDLEGRQLVARNLVNGSFYLLHPYALSPPNYYYYIL
jgi:hypothetical protein